MSLEKSKKIALGLLILCIVILGAYSGLTLAETGKENSQFSNNAMLTKNRENVTICIEDYTNSFESSNMVEFSNKVAGVLNKNIKTHKNWNKLAFSQEKMEVQLGCSFSPQLLKETATHPIYSGKTTLDTYRIVDAASKEQISIFIVDQEIINKHFNNAPSRWNPEEYLCENNVCDEVTSGIYLAAEEVIDSDNKKLIKELIFRVGVERISEHSEKHTH